MDKIWWNQITRAHKFLMDIVNAAAEGKSVVIVLPDQVPWRETLIDLIRDELSIEDPQRSYKEISGPEKEVGRYLLERFCSEEKRADYRLGMTYADFLGKSDDIVLNDRYIWVNDLDQKKLDEWIAFIADYKKALGNRKPGVFLLEVNDKLTIRNLRKGISLIRFDNTISAYDRFAFCTLASSDNTCKESIRPYLAEMVSAICREDIELAAVCVSKGTSFLKNPLSVIQEIREECLRSDGTAFSYSKTESEIDYIIWETQLKTLFPLIEKYRMEFIKKYQKAIEKCLPVKNSNGEDVTVPQDAELGLLLYLIGRGQLDITQAEYKEIVFYRNCRNSLAHLTTISWDDAQTILS